MVIRVGGVIVASVVRNRSVCRPGFERSVARVVNYVATAVLSLEMLRGRIPFQWCVGGAGRERVGLRVVLVGLTVHVGAVIAGVIGFRRKLNLMVGAC